MGAGSEEKSRRDGSGEMKSNVQKSYQERIRKKKRDRVRWLKKKQLLKKLSKKEERELLQLEAEL